jgi:uncharacterized protein (TIGR03086 family)
LRLPHLTVRPNADSGDGSGKLVDDRAMDLVAAYRRSLTEFTSRVPQVRAEQWSGPTPCREWDVRSLVNHVVGEDGWTAPLLAGATIAEIGDRFEGDLLGADPVASASGAARQAEEAVTEPGALDRTVHLSFGDTDAREYIGQLMADHLIHAWDLAVSVGADRKLDPEAVHFCAEWFTDHEDLYRAAGAIGPRVDVTPDADEQDRLLAAWGRDPGFGR